MDPDPVLKLTTEELLTKGVSAMKNAELRAMIHQLREYAESQDASHNLDMANEQHQREELIQKHELAMRVEAKKHEIEINVLKAGTQEGQEAEIIKGLQESVHEKDVLVEKQKHEIIDLNEEI